MTGDEDPAACGGESRLGAGAILLLLPAVCCGGPLVIAAIAADAGLTAWAASHGVLLGAGALLLAVGSTLLIWRASVRREAAVCVTGYGPKGGQAHAAPTQDHGHALP